MQDAKNDNNRKFPPADNPFLGLGLGGISGADGYFRQLVEMLREGLWIVDADGRTVYCNPHLAEMLGYRAEELMGKPFFEFQDKEHAEESRRRRTRCEAGIREQYYTEHLRKDGTPLKVLVQTVPLFAEDSAWAGCMASLMDVSASKHTEEALRESQQFAQKVVEASPNLLYVYGLFDRRCHFVSRKLFSVLGYKPDEIDGFAPIDFERLLHPDDQAKMQAQLQRLETAAEGEVCEVEYRIRHANGQWRYLRSRDVVFSRGADGCPKEILGIAENIDERKRAEHALAEHQSHLRSLASQLVVAEERERRQIASVLHDRIGQSLALCRIRLEMLQALAKKTALLEPLQELERTVRELIQETRSLTFELSPPVLYEVGLEAALKSLLRNIQQQTGLSCRLVDDGQPKPLDRDTRAMLYQAARELVVNAVKHAQAREVLVAIRRVREHVVLSVADDGRGFDLSAIRRQPSEAGFGLFSLRERMQSIGARFEISSQPDKGTTVVLAVPLPSEI